MKTLIKTTITLAAIGVAMKVIDAKIKNSEFKLRADFDSKLDHLIKIRNNDNELIIKDDYAASKKPFEFKNEPSIKNTTVTNVPVQKITGFSDLPQ